MAEPACPVKNKEWFALVESLGEDNAYLAFFRHQAKGLASMPSLEMAREHLKPGKFPTDVEGKPVYGIKNELSAKDREILGMGEREAPETKGWEPILAKAKAREREIPNQGSMLVEEFKDVDVNNAKVRNMTDDEIADLAIEKIKRKQAFNKALDDYASAKDEGEQERAAVRLDIARAQWGDLVRAAEKSGTVWGRAGAIRRMLITRDYTIPEMEAELRAAQGGDKLSKEQISMIADLQAKLADAEAKLKVSEEGRSRRRQKAEEDDAQAGLDELLGEVEGEKKRRSGGGRRPKGGGEEKEPPTHDEIIAKLQGGADKGVEFGLISQNWLKLLAKYHISEGANKLETLIPAMKADLEGIFPGVTERDVRVALSGYGKTSVPSQEPVERALRDLSAQSRLLSAIEDAGAGKPPERTGPQRDKPSDKQREMNRELQELLKKNNIKVVDPEQQLKTALDAAKTRLKNSISDIERRISDIKQGISTPKAEKTQLTYDEEANALRKHRDELKKTLQELEGKPEMSAEAKIAMAEKSLERTVAEYERMIAEGDVAPKAKGGPVVTSPKIEELRAKRDELKAFVDEARKNRITKQTPNERAIAQLRKRIDAKKAELERRIKEHDYTPMTKPKRERVIDRDTQNMQLELNKIVNKYHEALAKARYSQLSRSRRLLNTVPSIARVWKLTGIHTLGKLATAVVYRGTEKIAEQFVASKLAKLPILSRVAARSGRYTDFILKVEARALAKAATQGMLDAAQTLKTGKGELDVLLGKNWEGTEQDWGNFIAHVHGMEKAPLKRFEYERSLAYRMEKAMKAGIDVTDPMVQMKMQIDAYHDGKEAILMGENWLVKKYQNILRESESKKKPAMGDVVMPFFARLLLPIVKVPSNFVKHTAGYAVGTQLGTGRLILASRAAMKSLKSEAVKNGETWSTTKNIAKAIRKGIEDMSPEQGDLIMKNFAQGAIGAGAMLLGFFEPDKFGGYYQFGDKRDPEDIKAAHIRLGGIDLPGWAGHSPLIEVMQMGATIRRVYDKQMEGDAEDSEAVAKGLMAAGVGLFSEIPFVDQAGRLESLLGSEAKSNRYISEFIKGTTIPIGVAQLAQMGDVPEGTSVWDMVNPFSKVEPIKRDISKDDETGERAGLIKETWQGIKSSLPVLRKEVPEKEEE